MLDYKGNVDYELLKKLNAACKKYAGDEDISVLLQSVQNIRKKLPSQSFYEDAVAYFVQCNLAYPSSIQQSQLKEKAEKQRMATLPPSRQALASARPTPPPPPKKKASPPPAPYRKPAPATVVARPPLVEQMHYEHGSKKSDGCALEACEIGRLFYRLAEIQNPSAIVDGVLKIDMGDDVITITHRPHFFLFADGKPAEYRLAGDVADFEVSTSVGQVYAYHYVQKDGIIKLEGDNNSQIASHRMRLEFWKRLDDMARRDIPEYQSKINYEQRMREWERNNARKANRGPCDPRW